MSQAPTHYRFSGLSTQRVGAAIPVWSFDATLVGSGFYWVGEVEQMLRHAAVAAPFHGENSLTLLHPSQHLVPLGVRIPWELARPFKGAQLQLYSRRLILIAADGRSRVMLLQGQGVCLKLRAESGPTSACIPLEQLARLRLSPRTRALLGQSTSLVCDATEREMMEQAGGGLRGLAQLICDREVSQEIYRQAMTPILGLGPGSTPTGDDLIVGLAAAACRFSKSCLLDEKAVGAFLEALASLPRGVTTPTSREMLLHASQRTFVEPLLGFVGALGEMGDNRQLSEQAARLSGVGSHSGNDMMAGVLCLVRFLQRQFAGELQ